MFAFLRGIVARKALDHIELDVNGVGYEVWVTEPTCQKLIEDAPAMLLTYCHIRENIFQIFGFLREEQRALFKMLLEVSGVGPKVALAILSALTVPEFSRALLDNDVKSLTRANGVGKKLSQRIILEIKAKLGHDTELDAILGKPADTADLERDDVVTALCALGCTVAEARKAAAWARNQSDKVATTDEELVRLALKSLRTA
jgi:Holliday junction DNA helicase RuvA